MGRMKAEANSDEVAASKQGCGDSDDVDDDDAAADECGGGGGKWRAGGGGGRGPGSCWLLVRFFFE